MITVLSAKPEDDPKVFTIPAADPNAWDDRNDKFLGGVNAPYMAIDDRHPYNKRAYSHMMFTKYGISVPVANATSTDNQSLKDDIGKFDRLRKQK